jgi:hypothetical protein
MKPVSKSAPRRPGIHKGNYLCNGFSFNRPATRARHHSGAAGPVETARRSLLNFKCMTWQAKVPKPAPPTAFDGDWEGVEDEGVGLKIHLIYHIHNTEDGLMVLFDCPEEKIKGVLASKGSFDQASRQFSITIGQAIWLGR